MKQIKIADATLCRQESKYSFKEKIEIARQLENLNVSIIELPEIQNEKADALLIRTISSFVKKSILSVGAGINKGSVESAIAALSSAQNPLIRIELPVSPVGMEYTLHKKNEKMLEYIEKCIKTAKESVSQVEFCAVDATRAEPDFLKKAIETAAKSGATYISVCDSAGGMFPDDFARFAKEISEYCGVPMGVRCNNKNGFALSSAALAVRSCADIVKTSVDGDSVCLDDFCEMIKNCGNDYGIGCSVKQTELKRIVKQIRWIADNAAGSAVKNAAISGEHEAIYLDKNDDQEAVIVAAAKIGYDLSSEDQAKVYEEFLRVADKKKVGYKELEAIIASVALQVPATYKLVNYVINTGNIISASAQITLSKDDKTFQGVSIGDGPIDATFLAIDQIIGRHFELDDFQIQSVTEGKEAMGSALIKLRSGGKLYSGNGISTDIIAASIKAYINAVNKIVYEEA